jgi:hypothetical protein
VQVHGKGRALACHAVHADLARHRLRQQPRDRRAEAVAFDAAVLGTQPVEGLEQGRDLRSTVAVTSEPRSRRSVSVVPDELPARIVIPA